MSGVDSDVMALLADLLDACDPDDDEVVRWGSLRRQVRAAAEQARRRNRAIGGQHPTGPRKENA